MVYTVKLKEIAAENFDAVINLKVKENQKAFVSSVRHSLAQAWLYKENAFPFAVYEDDIPVGFVMLGFYEARNQYTLWKFLIDEKFQNKGIGRKALKLALIYLRDNLQANEVYTGVSLGNEKAKHLYISEGFEPTGLIENNMEELKLRFNL